MIPKRGELTPPKDIPEVVGWFARNRYTLKELNREEVGEVIWKALEKGNAPDDH